jgi:hypothetical protein
MASAVAFERELKHREAKKRQPKQAKSEFVFEAANLIAPRPRPLYLLSKGD